MELGFVPDLGGGPWAPTRWARGERRKSLLRGLKIDEKALLPVETYRCERGGYLESYAR